MNISLLIGLLNNLEYNKHFYATTRALYPDIELCFVSYGSIDGTHEWLDSLADDNVKYYYSEERKTFSDTFNKATELASNEYVAYLHNDIVLAPGFIENLQPHLNLNTVVSYTTIEPPIFAGHERPGKIIHDLGTSLDSFDILALYEYVADQQIKYQNKTEPGITFFMCLSREKLLSIGGMDNLFNPMFCEDDDLIQRLNLIGMNCITALDVICYHFVSKTSRFSLDYQEKTKQIEHNSNRNFVRKWGFRKSIHNKTYDIGFSIKNCNLELLELLEPWCSNILIDDEMQVLTTHYIDKEQKNTSFDLTERILSTPFQTLDNEIIVEMDRLSFTQQEWLYLNQLSDMIHETNEIGIFQLGGLKISINQMNEYQNDLIKL